MTTRKGRGPDKEKIGQGEGTYRGEMQRSRSRLNAPCVECGEKFAAHHSPALCSAECRRARRAKLQRDRRAGGWGAGRFARDLGRSSDFLTKPHA